jgi:Rrf2 family protein
MVGFCPINRQIGVAVSFLSAEERLRTGEAPSRGGESMGPKLSRTVGYAVAATLQLARRGGDSPIPCNQLAAEGNMPERFLLQILRSLVTAGILKSTRGVVGGYALNKPAEEISLLEIMEAVEGPYQSQIVDQEEGILSGNASLRDALSDMAETSKKQLSAIRLSQIAMPPKKD